MPEEDGGLRFGSVRVGMEESWRVRPGRTGRREQAGTIKRGKGSSRDDDDDGVMDG